MIRRPKISKHEIIADLIFIFVSMVIGFLIVLTFDTHWSFYPENLGKQLKFIFKSLDPYIIGVLFSGIVGLILFKLIFYAFSEEKEAVEETKNNKKKIG